MRYLLVHSENPFHITVKGVAEPFGTERFTGSIVCAPIKEHVPLPDLRLIKFSYSKTGMPAQMRSFLTRKGIDCSQWSDWQVANYFRAKPQKEDVITGWGDGKCSITLEDLGL